MTDERTDKERVMSDVIDELAAFHIGLLMGSPENIQTGSREAFDDARKRLGSAPSQPDLPAAVEGPSEPEWIRLAAIIREVDGNHDLGAGELAARILAHPDFAEQARAEAAREALEGVRRAVEGLDWIDDDVPFRDPPIDYDHGLLRRAAVLAAIEEASQPQEYGTLTDRCVHQPRCRTLEHHDARIESVR